MNRFRHLPSYHYEDNTDGILNKSVGKPLRNYKIYGDSIQDGTPTPDNPIEVESVGDYDEKIGKYKLPVKVNGKNLFNRGELTRDYAYTERYGKYGIKQIKPASGNAGFRFPVDIKQGTTFNLSFKLIDYNIDDDRKRVYCRLRNAGGTTVQANSATISDVDKIYSIDYTAEEDLSYAEFYTQSVWEAGTYYTIDNIMISILTDTNFEPYVEPIITSIYLDEPLRKVGNYADYIDFENQKVIRNVGNKIFDGTENWEIHTTTDEGAVFRNENLLTPLIGASIFDTFMTHFALTDIYSTATFTNGLFRFTYTGAEDDRRIGSSRVYVSAEQTTVEDFKSWLSENKPIIMYPLAEPDDMEIVELPNIPTIKGTTITEIDTTVQPSAVNYNYYKGGR